MLRQLGLSAIAVIAAACATPQSADAQMSDPKDINGVWQVLNTANYNIEAHPAQAALQLREGPVVPVPAKEVLALGAVGAVPAGNSVVVGGELPYTADALEQRNENRANYLENDPEVKCYLPGVPRATYANDMPFRIFVSESQALFVYEYANAVRNILLEDPGEAPIDSWMGQSWGKWDGDTFVVETTAQNGQTWLDRSGNFLGYGAVVTERFKKISPYHIRYEATINDEENFTRPWTMSMILYKKIEEDAQLQEFNCVEFVEEMMYGHLRKNPLD